jgi:hypothetical protein
MGDVKMTKDDRVREILAKFDEDLSSTWLVQGQRVIYHAALGAHRSAGRHPLRQA